MRRPALTDLKIATRPAVGGGRGAVAYCLRGANAGHGGEVGGTSVFGLRGRKDRACSVRHQRTESSCPLHVASSSARSPRKARSDEGRIWDNATTDLAYSDVLLTRVGGQPTKIPVTAAQRLAADPAPVATATALGLLATMVTLINSFFGKARAHHNRRGR